VVSQTELGTQKIRNHEGGRSRVKTEAEITGPASFTYFVNELTLAVLPEPALIWLLAASFFGAALRRYH